MTEPAESYTAANIRDRLRSQARHVWVITVAVVLGWLLSIVAAPLYGLPSVYTFFSYICHQIAERSLQIGGDPMAVCSRCFGIYGGLLIGVAVYPFWRPIDETEPISKIWLFLSVVPIAVDWSLTVFGIWENTHLTRVLTGIILGAACATFIMPALVDITRNLTLRWLKNK